jgi:hypothetical protein
MAAAVRGGVGTFYARGVPESIARDVRTYCAASGITMAEYVERAWKLYRAAKRAPGGADRLRAVGLHGDGAVEVAIGSGDGEAVVQARNVPREVRIGISALADERKMSLADWVLRTWALRQQLIADGDEDGLLARVGLPRLDIT